MSRDETFMRLALAEAEKAAALGEVPVGAVVVKDGAVVAAGHNTRESGQTALGHAELAAITEACRALGSWRLDGCTLYVTLEPCPMCAGACINARLPRVVFGAFDNKAGCFGSLCDLSALRFDTVPDVFGGVLDGECAALLADFFARARRKKGKADA